MTSLLLATSALLLATVAAPATAQVLPPVPVGQLSDAARPLGYRIDLTVRPAQERFAGHAEIDTEIRRTTRNLFLHGLGLEVQRVIARVDGQTVTARYTQVDPSGVARLDFASDLPAGRVTLIFDYTASFMTGSEGLYRAKVGEDWYAWTQMEPIDARRVFPGFDEPGFKTPFALTIAAPTGQKVFANTPEQASMALAGGMTRHVFAASKPLPTYLVALAVGPFDEVTGSAPANSVRRQALPYHVIATRGQADRLKQAATEGPRILALHEEYFGSPYPFEKLDQIASPVMSGAMENAGLVTYNDTILLLSADAPASQRRGFGTTVAHELAHQWFGDLVTPKWWTDIWLNESFAEWAGNRVGEIWQPGLGTDVAQMADAFEAMEIDSRAVGRPIRQPITRSDQVASAFDSITYLKGGQVLTMVERYLGADKFRRGVQYHLNRFRYANASAEDFFESMAKGSGEPGVVPVFQSFVTQTGVPVIGLRADATGWQLTQQRYHPIGQAAGTPQSWSVPVCARQGEVRHCTLLTGATGHLPLAAGTPAVPNADGAGYWRYSMDDAGWAALMQQADALPAREAMAAADSLWADFTAGNATFARVIDSARTLSRHRERSATLQLPEAMAGLERIGLSPAAEKGFRRFAAEVSLPRLKALGDVKLATGAYAQEETGQSLLRQSLVSYAATSARDPVLRRQLAASAQAAVRGNAGALDPAYRLLALSVAVEDLPVSFMDRLRDALVASSDPLFRSQSIKALGHATTEAQVKRALALTQDQALQSTERLQITIALAGQPLGRDALFQRLSADFDGAVAPIPAFVRPRIAGLFSGYCSADKAAAVEALFRPRLATLGGGQLELGQSLGSINQCIALKQAKGAEIEAALSTGQEQKRSKNP